MGFIATLALKNLGVELALGVSRYFDLLDPTGSGDQITSIGVVTIPFALGSAFSPAHAEEIVELLAHHAFQHHANGTAGQFAQILSERLLVRQRWDWLLLR
jgi:hypothetical protein